MTKPVRLPCVNPACRRTGPAEQYGESDIVCRGCFKLLPRVITDRYAQLRRRERRLLKLIEKRVLAGTINGEVIEALEHRVTEQAAQNWQLMRDYFRHRDRPLGLEGFLQEIGL